MEKKNNLMKTNVNRRNFLRGLGVTMALPAFESLVTRSLGSVTAPAVATTATGAPLRARVENGEIAVAPRWLRR